MQFPLEAGIMLSFDPSARFVFYKCGTGDFKFFEDCVRDQVRRRTNRRKTKTKATNFEGWFLFWQGYILLKKYGRFYWPYTVLVLWNFPNSWSFSRKEQNSRKHFSKGREDQVLHFYVNRLNCILKKKAKENSGILDRFFDIFRKHERHFKALKYPRKLYLLSFFKA